MKTFLKSAQNKSLSSEICSGSSHEIGRSLPIVWPLKFPRNFREIGRFFREFVPENPAKFDFFSATYQKPCLLTKLFRSRWLDIGLVLFCEFMDLNSVRVHKHAKKELGQYPAILISRLVSNPYIQVKWPIKLVLISSVNCMKWLGVFLLPGMGCQFIATLILSNNFAGTHVVTWVERGTVKVVSCSVSLAWTQTQTAQSGGKQ